MTRASERAGWIAPLLVGASAAVAGEVAVGILLYTGPGLMRSLTAILAVEGAALAAGLWRGAALEGNAVERLRVRWLFCLGAFAAAALFGTAWSVVQDLGGGRWGQGLGLSVLAALPLYAAGLVLGGMSAVAADTTGHARPTGASAALGAAIGFVITGLLLPRAPIPSSLLVACLVMLSGAGLVFGAVLGDRRVVHLRALRAAATGDVRVEDHVTTGDEPATRYLLESGHVRGSRELEGEQATPWDVAVADTLLVMGDAPRVLAVGGGASPLAHILRTRRPGVRLHVLERGRAVVELGHEHLDTGLAAWASPDVHLEVGHLDDLALSLRDSYDLVLVDARALAPLGGAAGLSRAAWSALFDAVEPDGAMAYGPSSEPSEAPAPPGGWGTDTLPHGDGAVVLLRPISVVEGHGS